MTKSDAETPLIVDLDGTLSRTDTLHEAVLGMVAKSPLTLLKLPGWLAGGRARFKAEVADRHLLDPTILPLNTEVVATIEAARKEGRKTALVSAADHRQVTAVAEATGLFDAAYGSAEGRNLKGAEKARFLNETYGEKGFDYIGDSKADLPVWAAARKAISIQAAAGLRKAAEAANPEAQHLDPPRPKAKSLFRALRPHQWSKNLLLFLPMLAAHDLSKLMPSLLGFISFCLTASAVYVINDLVDLEADRHHPRKCRRPFAAGDLSAKTGILLALALLVLALITGISTGNPLLLGVLGFYLLATFAYSLWLKRRVIVDVLMLSGLYTWRIIAGAVAAAVVLSPWLLGFSIFLFLSLAAVKRQAELTDQIASGRDKSGRAYEPDDLPILRNIAISAGQAAVLIMALYISSDDVQTLYGTPEFLWLICPVLLYWALRMIMKAHRGQMSDDPIVFAATDRVSLLLILACAGVVGLAI